MRSAAVLVTTVALFGTIAFLAACGADKSRGDPQARERVEVVPPTGAPKQATRKPAGRAAAIAHAGVGTPPERSDGCRAAVDAALKLVESGVDPLDAAVAGVVVLEDDPRLNAGTGSAVRLDGRSVQMDASVMRSDGRFAAVSGLEFVKNPVKVARAVMDTPHLLIQGDGAIRFARQLGFAPYDPTTDERRDKAREVREKLLAHDPSLPPEWQKFDWQKVWNFEGALPSAQKSKGDKARKGSLKDAGVDTVGVAVRTADGRFGVALSTGGMALAMRGRVGDVPIYGAGLFAGEHGAAAATGKGERIIEEGLARRVQEWLKEGDSAQRAAERAVAAIQGTGDIGIIVVAVDGLAAAADRPMAWAGREAGSASWSGP
jgi:isoaspartyl peptidase/L-asparaginase-like protein (Ntn-hydrolase superfamily)